MNDEALFTDEQRALLKAALNRIIPAEGQLPAAGDLGAADVIEKSVGSSASRRRLFLDGLARLDLTAWKVCDRSFLDLPPERQDQVLRIVEQTDSSFFDKLVVSTYRAYYVHSTVVQLVGASPHPPQPAGFSLPPFDPARLENVRKRGAIYRQIQGKD